MDIYSQTFGLVETNSYLLFDKKSRQAIWVDPAEGSGAWIDQLLKDLDCNFTALYTLITHSHWDHISDIGKSLYFKDKTVFVHEKDLANVKNPGSDGLAWPFEVGKPQVSFLQTFKEGDCFNWGEHRLKVLLTPGHSPGSCCFLCNSLKFILTGDTLFAFGYGRLDLPTSSPREMKSSLHRLAQLNRDLEILPGHGQRAKLDSLGWLFERFG